MTDIPCEAGDTDLDLAELLVLVGVPDRELEGDLVGDLDPDFDR